jgi:hypothetical protein
MAHYDLRQSLQAENKRAELIDALSFLAPRFHKPDRARFMGPYHSVFQRDLSTGCQSRHLSNWSADRMTQH